jgi:hypothetical protein
MASPKQARLFRRLRYCNLFTCQQQSLPYASRPRTPSLTTAAAVRVAQSYARICEARNLVKIRTNGAPESPINFISIDAVITTSCRGVGAPKLLCVYASRAHTRYIPTYHRPGLQRVEPWLTPTITVSTVQSGKFGSECELLAMWEAAWMCCGVAQKQSFFVPTLVAQGVRGDWISRGAALSFRGTVPTPFLRFE